MNQELVTYIVLGSHNRLKKLKSPSPNKFEEYLFSSFKDDMSYEKRIDYLITKAKGRIIVLLPPSCFPNSKSKELLNKISMIDISTWGWFAFNEKNKNFLQNIKKYTSSLRSIPNIEQGLYFSKRLYFSVGGFGKFKPNPFKEISKRFYTRIDPQNPLPPLIIRTKNFDIF